MRLRHIPGAEETIAASPYVVQDPQAQKGRWNLLFGNANPIQIEVGMGKGRFIMELAQKNPGINYIGIERYSSVLLRGLQKRAELELDNIFFMCIDAKTLADVFAPGEVNRIYLNFSDPWPKDRHAKRRLIRGSLHNNKHNFSMGQMSHPPLEMLTQSRSYLLDSILVHFVPQEQYLDNKSPVNYLFLLHL